MLHYLVKANETPLRLRGHRLLDGAQTGKYLKYALGKIVLVRIGILPAGASENNWNEERKERTQGELLRQNIHREFLHNNWQNQQEVMTPTATLEV